MAHIRRSELQTVVCENIASSCFISSVLHDCHGFVIQWNAPYFLAFRYVSLVVKYEYFFLKIDLSPFDSQKLRLP